MRIISTFYFFFLYFHASAQLNEVILSSYFKTVPPKQTKTTITCGTFLCGFGRGMIVQDNIAVLPAVKPGGAIHESIDRHTQPRLLPDPKQKDFVQQPAQGGMFKETRIMLRCGRVLTNDSSPRLLVDGNLTKLEMLSTINPDDIVSITILKGPAAMAIYGSEGANGIIVVNLKLKYKQFVVLDANDLSPVSRASVGITMKNGDKTMWYVADDNGKFSSNSPKEFNGLQMTVSAVGYETATRHFNGNISYTDTIRLKRTIKSCDEVVIAQACHPRKIVCYGCAKVTKGGTGNINAEIAPSFRIYPNPLTRGGTFTVVVNDEAVKSIRLVSLDGREFLRQQTGGKTVLQVQADTRWAAGFYFVQGLYENGGVAASGKIIIQ